MRSMTRAVSFVVLCFVGACSYALPAGIQQEVDSIAQQMQSLYGVVETVQQQASGTQLTTAKTRYAELVSAHGVWADQAENAIMKEIDYFENDEKYINSVNKLNDASGRFEEVASDVIGAPVDVPDFANEMRNIIKDAQAERKMKKAGTAVFEQLGSLQTWEQIAALDAKK